MSDLPDKYDHALMTLWELFKDYQKLRTQVNELEAAICISVREEFSEAEVENDKQAIEWFTGTFNETNYR